MVCLLVEIGNGSVRARQMAADEATAAIAEGDGQDGLGSDAVPDAQRAVPGPFRFGPLGNEAALKNRELYGMKNYVALEILV
jgi:hypothetical protein